MKRWLLVVPVIAVLAIFALRPSATNTAGKIFPNFRPDDVSSIIIEAPANHVILTRGDEGWTVLDRDHFPADSSRITQVLRQTWDLRPTQEIQAKPTQLERFQLADPQSEAPLNHRATKVSFLDKKLKPLAVLLLGKRQTRGGRDGMPGQVFGRFVIPSDHQGSVFLTNELFHEVLPSPMAWLDLGFPKIKQPQAFEYQGPQDSWKVGLKDGQWKLADSKDSELLDPNKLYSLLTQWAEPSFFDVTTADHVPDFTQAAQLTIKDLNGESVIYEIGKSKGAASPVKVRVGEANQNPDRWKDRIFWVDAPLIDAIPTKHTEILTVVPHPAEVKTPAKL